MRREFTEYEIDILKQVAREEEEVYVEDRKGISQSKFIMEVKEGEYFCYKVDEYVKTPKNLIGFWMMSYPVDLSRDTLYDVLDYGWVKCKQVVVKKTVWKEVITKHK